MKTNKKRTICSVLLLLCLLTASLNTSLAAVYAKGAASTEEKTTYVAFGDSIAAGYGLPGYQTQTAPADSYQALTAGFLQTQPHNYAVTGDNSDDCIFLLNSGEADESLAAADVITLSIGSNDLLLPFIDILMQHFHIDAPASGTSQEETPEEAAKRKEIEEQLKNGFSLPQLSLSEMAEYYKQAEALLSELSDHATLHAQAAAFAQKFQAILSILKEKAPNAEIYVTNIYNPFAFLPKIGEMADVYIREINEAFAKDVPGYTLIDVYTPFQKQELTNVHIDLTQPNGIQLDPHPSKEGHRVIGELIVAALKQAHAPKAASISSLSSSSKKKLTLKATLPANADGYEILYAPAKNGTYKRLATADKKTYQSNAKKLKSGKTYYVKVRSFCTVKGVTYYGKDSSAKKLAVK
ncbi:MAG: SGNH/GDSL hydrolase family protein [Eubacterium sp.]|nr:SGNH/GDSL hydrolase family protein [Eubacterium sp.]